MLDQCINYLLSHEGIQVLWDDMTADKLEELAYYLCYLYTQPGVLFKMQLNILLLNVLFSQVRVMPAPTYYFHLAADRARNHHDQ